ncbi:MAG: nuclear protein [Candidatus Kaiserbacteria bacterium]|nr:nuclear protein [Candidatus Kaiserbacteria bacterium]
MSSKNKLSDKFEVKRSAPGAGLGLFTLVPFKKGDFVIEYTGDKIPTPQANKLSTRYLFEIDEKWTIDGSKRGNLARYINHSCDPNCETEIDEKDRIIIHAIKNIKAGDELGYDYGEEYFDQFLKDAGCRCKAKKHQGGPV